MEFIVLSEGYELKVGDCVHFIDGYSGRIDAIKPGDSFHFPVISKQKYHPFEERWETKEQWFFGEQGWWPASYYAPEWNVIKSVFRSGVRIEPAVTLP